MTNLLKKFKQNICRWHNQAEIWFMQNILIAPEGHANEIKSTLKEYSNGTSKSDNGNVVFDIGGRKGVWSEACKNNNFNYAVLDITSPDHYSEQLPQNFIQADAHQLPVQNNSVKGILCFEMLEHCRYPAKILQELSRVLKDDGFLILSTRQYWATHGCPQDYFRYTQLGLIELFKEASFDVVKTVPLGGPMSIVASVINVNIPFLNKPILKQLFIYPLWLICTVLDKVFFLPSKLFKTNPDTTGWIVVGQKKQ